MSKNSYENPGRPQQDPMSASVQRSVKEAKAAEAANLQRDPNVTSLIQSGVGMLSAKKDAMKGFTREVLKEERKMYEKVGGMTTGYNGYDKKAESFFEGLIDQYNVIKSHLDAGTMKDANLGKRDLATIKNLIDQYGEAIPKVLGTAKAITAASEAAGREGMGSPNTLSVAGAPPAQLAIIKKISSGGPSGEDIEISHRDGTIVLYDTRTGAELNMKEFNKAITNKNNPYLKYVPDLKKGMTNAFDAFNKNHEGALQETYTKEIPSDTPGGEPTRVMPMQKEEDLKIALMGAKRADYDQDGNPKLSKYHSGGAYEKMITDFGESIWEDMMPDGLTKGIEYESNPPIFGDDGYDEYYNKYYKPMLDYLATTTINNNTQGIQRESQNKERFAELYPDLSNNKDATDYDKRYKGDSKQYEERQKKFTTDKKTQSGFSAADQAKIESAQPGDIVELTSGLKIRKT
jgi:hypothetical protein